MEMKRLRRIACRISVSIAVIVLAVVVLSLDGVDHKPYFRETYYQESAARLRAGVATNSVQRGVLSAGFGRARLTPVVDSAQDEPNEGKFRSMPLAGYGSRRGKPATGVHDDLYVKAVAFRVGDRTGVMVGADALIIPAEVTDAAMRRLERESNLAREQVYLSATHTHCSLGGWGEGIVGEAFAGGFQPGAGLWFSDCIVRAVQEAIADLKPAALGHGHFDAPQFIRNRLVGELGRVDPEFSYLLVKQEGGRKIILGSYGAHATVLSGNVMEFSADYPGVWQRAVEQATGGAALFLAGGVGSHSPVPGAKGFAGTEQMGQALALMLLDQLPRVPLTNHLAFGILGLELTMPPLNVRVSDGVRLRPWLARKLVPARPQSYLQVFRLNDSLWISTPCDFSGELALDIKNCLRVRGYNAVITSFNGDYVGYVIPSRYYHLNGYEPRLMSFFGPNVPDYFNEFMRDMAIAVTRP